MKHDDAHTGRGMDREALRIERLDPAASGPRSSMPTSTTS